VAHPTSKNVFSLCHWKCCCVIFLLVRCISSLVVQFVADRPFFSFFSLFFPENYSLIFLVIDISTLVLIIFIFFILVFLQKFYLFSILSLNPNLSNIIFSNLIFIIWISNFFSWSFCKSYYSFQFYHLITTLFLFLCQFWVSFFF